MDSKDIQLHEAFNVTDTRTQFITDDVMVYRSGNTIVFFNVTTKRETTLSFPTGYSLDCFAVAPDLPPPPKPVNENGGGLETDRSNKPQRAKRQGKLVVALHKLKTEIHVFKYPQLKLLRKLEQPPDSDWICLRVMSISRCGKFLATVSKFGASYLTVWDLERKVMGTDGWTQIPAFEPIGGNDFGFGSGQGLYEDLGSTDGQVEAEPADSAILYRRTVPDNVQIVSFNPFAYQQLCIGHSKRIDVYNMSNPPTYGKPSVKVINVQIEANNVEREVVCHEWIGDNRLVFASRTGEILITDLPGAPHNLEEKKLPTLHSRSGARHSRRMSIERQAMIEKSVQLDDPDAEPDSASPVPVITSLPSIGKEDEENERRGGRRRRREKKSAPPKAPITYSLAVTKRHLLAGTEEGALMWIDTQSWRVVNIQNLNKVGMGSSIAEGKSKTGVGICSLSFNPVFESITALNLRGHLRMIRIIGDMAKLEYKQQEATLFQSLSLGHFPISVGLRSHVPNKYGVCMLPTNVHNNGGASFGGGVPGSSQMAQLAVTWTVSGMIQLWYFGTRELMNTYHFDSEISCVTPSPDGQLLMVGLSSGVVAALDVSNARSLRLIFAPKLHLGPVLSLAFNAEGDMFASIGPERVFFVRGGDLHVIGYAETKQYFNQEEDDLLKAQQAMEEMKQEAEKESEQKNEFQPDENTDNKQDNGDRQDKQDPALAVEEITAKEEEKERKRKEEEEREANRDRALCLAWCGLVDDSDVPRERIVIGSTKGRFLVITAPGTYYQSQATLLLSDKLINPTVTTAFVASSCFTPDPRDPTRFWSLTLDKKMKLFQVQQNSNIVLKKQYSSHLKPGSYLAYSNNQQVIASASVDGSICLRSAQSASEIATIHCHDFSVGGATACCFSEDDHFLATAGADGAVFVWNISNILERLDLLANVQPTSHPITITFQALQDMPIVEEPGENMEDFVEQYRLANLSTSAVVAESKMRNDLIRQIERFREGFVDLLYRNETAPELEKLELLEFAVDLELRDQLIEQGQKDVSKMRAEIEYAYRGKELRTWRIKRQCWDSMKTHGSLFKAFKSDVEVSNFPERILSPAEEALKRKVANLRKLEIMQAKWLESKRYELPSNREFVDDIFTKTSRYVMFIDFKEEEKDDPLSVLTTTNAKKQDVKEQENKDVKKDEYAKFLFYHPVGCMTPIRKRTQSYLLSNRIQYLKTEFNFQYDNLYEFKQQAIDQIHVKGKRIKEIQEELQKEDEPVYLPVLSPEEIPDSVLTVDDSEVTAEKVLTAKEQAEKDIRDAEAARLAALADDGPERALQTMMNGTLETKRDLSLLERQLEREPWMDEIDPEEWTDEQKQAMAAHEQKVEEIRAEQETRRKLLQTELVKIRNEVSEICRSFDHKIRALVATRVSTRKQILELELMIIKLMNDIVNVEQQTIEQEEIETKLNKLLEDREVGLKDLQEFRVFAEQCQKQLETLLTEEKSMERHFRRDFSDAGEYVDYLYRLFKMRKPRNNAKANAINAAAAAAAAATNQSALPQSGRRGSVSRGRRGSVSLDPNARTPRGARMGRRGSRRGSVTSEADSFMEEEKPKEKIDPYPVVKSDDDDKFQFVELDPSKSPDELDPEIWIRFIQRRRAQIEKEFEVHLAEKKFTQIQRHLAYLQAIVDRYDNQINDLSITGNRLLEDREDNALNTELMLQVLQGQVEIDHAPVVTDMKDCEMIPRHMVQDLNKVIVAYGSEKVDSLKQIMAERTHIAMRRWTKKKLELEHKDRLDLTTELQLLRVTKSLQSLIKMGGHDNQKAAELKHLDHKIDFLNQATREKSIGKKLNLMKVRQKIRIQNKENERLLETVQELEAAVRERLQISAIRADDSQEDKKSSARMKALVTRRKLVDLAKLQNEEIKFLRDQVESLRKRTFASFAVPALAMNPDERNYNNISRARSRAGLSSRGSTAYGHRAQTR